MLKSKTINDEMVFHLLQARIYNGFHRFTEIGQIFQNESETQESGLKRFKIQNISPGGAWPWTPLEACASALVVSEIGHHLS